MRRYRRKGKRGIVMYCPNCRITFSEAGRCPVCGRKKVRETLPEDICFLTEVNPFFAGMLKDVLEQNEIPVLSNSSIGAGMAMRAGSMFERIRLYVRYDHLQRATEIAGELLNSSEVPESDGNE